MVSVIQKLINIHQAAELFGVSVRALRDYTRTGQVTSYQFGHFRKYDRDTLSRELLERGRRDRRAKGPAPDRQTD